MHESEFGLVSGCAHSESWEQFRKSHPAEAVELLNEYFGFSVGPDELNFELFPEGIVAHGRSLGDPWTWDPQNRRWSS